MNIDMKKVKEHLWGPIGSTILHVIIVIALIKLVSFVKESREPEVEVVIMEPDAVDLEELELEPEELEEPPEVVDTVTPPDVNVDMQEPPPVDDFESSEPEMDFEALEIVSDVKSPLVMKGLFAGRSGGGRSAALGNYGGKWGKHTEAAVLRALEWLKNNQLPNGSWGPKNHEAMTGLGLLTFLAHGETPASEKYGPTVEKAIRWMVEKQDARGAFTNLGGGAQVYAHAIASYAISEAYGVTRIPALKEAMDKAISVIIDGQQSGGSWDYKYAKGERWDLSVAGWHIQALKAAKISGGKHPKLNEAIERAVEHLKTDAYNESTGKFRYSANNAPGKETMTGVGVLCLQLTGNGKSSQAKGGLQALKTSDVDWEEPGHWALYNWYYLTQAKFHMGGTTWKNWNNKFAPVLVKNQNEDGSWTAPDKKHDAGGHAEHAFGHVYSTTLAALTLQVYYRFLPTYKAEATEAEETTAEEDDIEIEII